MTPFCVCAETMRELRQLAEEIRHKGENWDNRETLAWIDATVSNFDDEKADHEQRRTA